jgi:hypothetical protein
MTPQSAFMVLAPIAEGRAEDLRALLATMNGAPGVADPDNALVPFGRVERLHFARFVIVEAPPTDDIATYGMPRSSWPASLAFLGDCDGPADTLLAELARVAGDGLRRVFGHCRDAPGDGDLILWMTRRLQPAAATYVNRIGRTMRQIREEHALQRAIVDHVHASGADDVDHEPLRRRAGIVAFVEEELRAGRLTLSAPEEAPLGWRARNALDLVGTPVALAALAPLLLLASPALLFRLRSLETRDPVIDYRADGDRVAELSELEDHDVTNQFTVFGQVKPGRFRRTTMSALLRALDYSARHVYGRGFLARVQSIHAARWVFLDGGRRLFFASNYDGSVESYMDDFINKVAWGINLVFSNGMSYPPTRYLVRGGARDEQRYKRTLRRHQIPTQVWYNAHPGLTVIDLARNARIREGVERREMTEEEAREWLSLL